MFMRASEYLGYFLADRRNRQRSEQKAYFAISLHFVIWIEQKRLFPQNTLHWGLEFPDFDHCLYSCVEYENRFINHFHRTGPSIHVSLLIICRFFNLFDDTLLFFRCCVLDRLILNPGLKFRKFISDISNLR